jgi:hypothetical protein
MGGIVVSNHCPGEIQVPKRPEFQPEQKNSQKHQTKENPTGSTKLTPAAIGSISPHHSIIPSMPRRIRHVPARQPALFDFFFLREMVSATPTAQPMPNLALSATLAHRVSAQVFELGTRRAVNVVVLAGETVLAGV